jgi:hypothetical protein
MPSAYLLDALVIATVAMTLLVAAARLVDRWWPSRSGHVRHQVASHSLMAGLAVLVCTAVARPGPVGFSSSPACFPAMRSAAPRRRSISRWSAPVRHHRAKLPG